jgi:hypothetical protein
MASSSISTQLDHYLRSNSTEDDNPLVLWCSRSGSAPGLVQMAKDVLAVAIAGIGVERVFSAARRVCSYQQHQLSRDTMKKVMIVQDWEGFADEDDVGEGMMWSKLRRLLMLTIHAHLGMQITGRQKSKR